MKFMMVTKDSWREFDCAEDVIAAGFKQVGTSRSYADVLAANPKAAVPRPMLWAQPTFENWIGPMYGGEGVLRYETPEAYDLYSL
jgi:hypothetical protein